MNVRPKITSIRLIAILSCLLAIGTYAAFSPAPAKADEGCSCTYAGQSYSEGACRSGQRCACNTNGEGVWLDDSKCAPELE